MYKRTGTLLSGITAALLAVLALMSTPAMARHGEGNILTNRIPEPAPYEFSETIAGGGQSQNPPFENLWTSTDDVNGCTGCHTTLYDEWNGSMMANAWRDPGWRGAFLLVSRLTSTDGCADIAPTLTGGNAKDGSLGYDCSSAARKINPFANANSTSTFNMGAATATYSGSGSLMDDFCSRCHMPTNYIDATVSVANDLPSGLEHGSMSPTYDPTSVAAGSLALADPLAAMGTGRESFGTRTDGTRPVNSNSGKVGIVCEVCHTAVASRYTPYHLYNKSGVDYYAATKSVSRSDATQRDQFGNPLPANHQDMITVPDAASKNLGYAVAAGAFRLSPHALVKPERFGPLSWNDFSTTVDTYISDVFSGGGVSRTYYFSKANPPGKHETYYTAKMERAEFCASCHDVTNPATIMNTSGKWVGGFPIERTYTEYVNSRYADRTGNTNYDPNYKRDCQTCHMQQDYNEPGTAMTLYTISGTNVIPDAPYIGPSCDRVTHDPAYTHQFVGGNAYVSKMIGQALNGGTVTAYPQLLETSFSSTDETSRLHYARFTTAGTGAAAAATQHARFAWDRLRNALTMSLTAPTSVAKPATESLAALSVVIKNEGAGHNFPTGFPEGRSAWVAVHAFDTKNTASTADDVELLIQDSANANRRSLGVGYLTSADMIDPTFGACNWHIPAGSPDPYSLQYRAVSTSDGVCPTLDLPYASAKNLVVNAAGMPTDAAGVVIDRNNPLGIPRYTDTNANGDFFDDSFLRDTRLQPWKGTTATSPGATSNLSNYSVVIPSTIVGPISVTSAVYYQSFEAIVAKKFLGNLANKDDADTNEGFPGGAPLLEPCVLKGPCDRIGKAGATGEIQLRDALKADPIAVDGAPPVPVVVRTAGIQVTGTTDNVAPRVVINNSLAAPNTTAPIPANRQWSPSPFGGATGNYAVEGVGELSVDTARIVKISFSEAVTGVDSNTFYLTDSRNVAVPFYFSQIDDTTYALFPYTVSSFLSGATVYVMHVAPVRNGSAIKDSAGNTLPAGSATGGEYTFGFKTL